MQEKTSLVLVDKRGFFYGGAGGIRTHVAVTQNGFQVIWGEVKGPNLLRFKAIFYPKYTLLMHLSQYV